MWIWQHQGHRGRLSEVASVSLTEQVGAVIRVDAIGMGKGRVTSLVGTDDACAWCLFEVNQTQCPKPEGSVPTSEMEVVILTFPRRTVLPYCLWLKSSWVLWPEIAWGDCGTGTTHKGNLQVASIPIDVAPAAKKDINIKLCLECTKIMDLGAIEWVNGGSGNIAKGKVDWTRELRMVNRVPKSLFIQRMLVVL